MADPVPAVSEPLTTNPYLPSVQTPLDHSWNRTQQTRRRWPAPLLILMGSVAIGITVAVLGTGDTRWSIGEIPYLIFAFTGISIVYGSAGALFTYQYLLHQVPIWYSPTAIGFFTIGLPILRVPDIDPLVIQVVVVGVANILWITLVAWTAKHWFSMATPRPRSTASS